MITITIEGQYVLDGYVPNKGAGKRQSALIKGTIINSAMDTWDMLTRIVSVYLNKEEKTFSELQQKPNTMLYLTLRCVGTGTSYTHALPLIMPFLEDMEFQMHLMNIMRDFVCEARGNFRGKVVW